MLGKHEREQYYKEKGFTGIVPSDAKGEVKRKVFKTKRKKKTRKLTELEKLSNHIKRFKDRDPFYSSYKWLIKREQVFLRFGKICLSCYTKQNIQVDHIICRTQRPDLQYDIENLQPLCAKCNKEKGKKVIDYRTRYDLIEYDSLEDMDDGRTNYFRFKRDLQKINSDRKKHKNRKRKKTKYKIKKAREQLEQRKTPVRSLESKSPKRTTTRRNLQFETTTS